MKQIVFLALKDLRLLVRDRFGMFWVMAFPVMFAIFFGAVLSGEPQNSSVMTVGIVDLDGTGLSRQFAEKLGSHAGIKLEKVSPELASTGVRKGRFVSAIIIQKGFGNGFSALLDSKSQKLELLSDPSHRAESGMLQGMLMQSLFEAYAAQITDRQWARNEIGKVSSSVSKSTSMSLQQKLLYSAYFKSLDSLVSGMDASNLGGVSQFQLSPVKATSLGSRKQRGPNSYFMISFPQGILWALIGCAAGFAISLVEERNHGTLLRLQVAPLGRNQILAGKGLACFLACLAVTLLLVMVGVTAFGVRVQSWPLLLVSTFCSAICFVGAMVFISTLGSTEKSVAGAGWALFLVMSMFGGGMIPLFIMPGWMQRLSDFSPIKWGILSFEGAIWRGFTPREMLIPSAILLGAGILFFAMGVANLARRDGRRLGRA